MMPRNDKLQGTLERWLRYENTGDDGRAEAALGELLTALPPVEVPAGFASRILSSAGLGLAARRQRPRIPGWVWQAAFGAWIVSGFLTALGATGFAADLARTGKALELGTRFVVALSRLGAEAITVIGGLLRAGAAISAAFSGPGVLALVSVCALASLTALGALKPLLTSERSRHVESY